LQSNDAGALIIGGLINDGNESKKANFIGLVEYILIVK